MALNHCTDCEQSISTAAISCPHCGRPIRKQHSAVTRTGAKYEGIGFLLIAGGMVVTMTGYEAVGMPAAGLGFIVFIFGRFM